MAYAGGENATHDRGAPRRHLAGNHGDSDGALPPAARRTEPLTDHASTVEHGVALLSAHACYVGDQIAAPAGLTWRGDDTAQRRARRAGPGARHGPARDGGPRPVTSAMSASAYQALRGRRQARLVRDAADVPADLTRPAEPTTWGSQPAGSADPPSHRPAPARPGPDSGNPGKPDGFAPIPSTRVRRRLDGRRVLPQETNPVERSMIR